MRRTSGPIETLSLLGIARRAGAVACGSEATRRAVRDGTAKLVLIAQDASEGQVKKLKALVSRQSVPCRAVADRESLGMAVGHASLSAVAVTEDHLADEMLARLDPDPVRVVGREGGRN